MHAERRAASLRRQKINRSSLFSTYTEQQPRWAMANLLLYKKPQTPVDRLV